MIRTSSNGVNEAIIKYINNVLFEQNNLVSIASAFSIQNNTIVVNNQQNILPILQAQTVLTQKIQTAYATTLNKQLVLKEVSVFSEFNNIFIYCITRSSYH